MVNQSFCFIEILFTSPKCPSSVSVRCGGHWVARSTHISLDFSWLWQFRILFFVCFWSPLLCWGALTAYVKNDPQLWLSCCFSWLDLANLFWRRIVKLKCCHRILGVRAIKVTWHSGCSALITWSEGLLSGFSTMKLLLFSSSCVVVFGRKLLCTPRM